MSGNISPYRPRINIEKLMQRAQGRLQIILLAKQQSGVQNNIVDFVAHRQNRTVGIYDFTTFKRYCHRVVFLM